MSARWKLDDGRSLTLLMPKELEALPDGARLVCIDGTEVVKGQDKIDDDTRGGYLAYGVLDNAQRNPPCPRCAALQADVARLTALLAEKQERRCETCREQIIQGDDPEPVCGLTMEGSPCYFYCEVFGNTCGAWQRREGLK